MKRVRCVINQRDYDRSVAEHLTAVGFLREDLGLTGTKIGCGAGECGACTIIVDGRAVNACLMLAVELDGTVVQTIEGEATGGELSPIQRAFDRNHAVQCGFCTSGMVMTVKDLLQRNPHPSRQEVIEGIEGNFCRCTGYEQIIEAVLDVAANPTGDRAGAAVTKDDAHA